MTSTPISTHDVIAALDRRFAKRSTPGVPGAAVRPRPHVVAAAVLHVFDPKTVRPFGETDPSVDQSSVLFDLTVPAMGWRHRRLRSLKPEVRRAALRSLGSRDAMRQALDANPDRTSTSLQLLFERWLRDETIVLDQLSHPELEDVRQLHDWGLDEFGALPDRRELDTARLRRSSVVLFEHLVDANFVGREVELQMLRDFVGVVSPSVWARVRNFLARRAKAPLFVWGLGGVGKTALLGRFLLEHVGQAPAAGWFAFAYLPFDSDTLDVREPFTILVTAASQLSAQVSREDESRPEQERLRRAFAEFGTAVEHYRDERGRLGQRAASIAAPGGRLSDLAAVEDRLYRQFGEFLNLVADEANAQQRSSQAPVVFVLDTFEEVLYRAKEDLYGLWRMLDVLHEACRGLRVVMASRVEAPAHAKAGRELSEHKLADLKEDDAVNLLGRLGVDDPEAARAIARQIGGNPLTLRLAARVAREEAVASGGIGGLQTRRYFLFTVAPELIRGQLYRRLLDHIHDEDVRTLAHPGMVVRRVTPELIRDVLAPACGLSQVDSARAQDLFEQLWQEHALVSIDDDRSLRYREEVRRPMLELFARDKPAEVRAIHEAAASYYAAKAIASPIERAEEIYHRLMLNEGTEALGNRWIEGVQRYLSSAIDEIPLLGRIWLASRMSIELPSDVYRLADLAEWERLFGPKALEALRFQGPEGALRLLGERHDRTPESPLYAIEARALLALRQLMDAALLLDDALGNYPAMGNPGRLAELLWIRAQAAAAVGNFPEAASLLERLAGVASTLPSRLPLAQVLAELLSIREQERADPALLDATREGLAAALAALSEAEVQTERSLIRLALTRLGQGYPVTARRLIPLVIYDWLYFVDRTGVDIASALTRAAPILATSESPESRELAARMTEARDPSAAASIARQLVELTSQPQPDPRLIEATLVLMVAEQTTLTSSTLAGIEAYREPWELNVSREVAA